LTIVESQQPSEEFMTALVDLKVIWMDKFDGWELVEDQYKNLIDVGRRGVSFHFVDYKLNDMQRLGFYE
jgi:hypothetical protein